MQYNLTYYNILSGLRQDRAREARVPHLEALARDGRGGQGDRGRQGNDTINDSFVYYLYY